MRNKLILILIFLVLVGLLVTKKTGRSNNHIQIPIPSPTPSPTTEISNKVIFHGPKDKKVVALTFDADMTPKMKKDLEVGKVESWYNKGVIKTLEEKQIPATLFLTGMWIELYPKETAELAKNPLFELENHSYSHPSFSGKCFTLGTIPESNDEEEISKTKKLLADVAQVENHYFRFPGGCYDKDDLAIVKKLGLTTVLWDVSGNDGFNQNTRSIINKVLKDTQNGSIVVLHMHGGPNAPKTGEALPFIISGLTAKGFSFVKVSDLIRGL